MIKDFFRDLKNADYIQITLSLTTKNLNTTFIHQSAESSAILLHNVIIDIIHRFVPLKTFHRSFFPIWVLAKLKTLLYKKIFAHKNIK